MTGEEHPPPGGGAGRASRIAGGLLLAAAGVAMFLVLMFGVRDDLIDLGRLGPPIFLALRVFWFAAIAAGCWIAYRNWRRI